MRRLFFGTMVTQQTAKPKKTLCIDRSHGSPRPTSPASFLAVMDGPGMAQMALFDDAFFLVMLHGFHSKVSKITSKRLCGSTSYISHYVACMHPSAHFLKYHGAPVQLTQYMQLLSFETRVKTSSRLCIGKHAWLRSSLEFRIYCVCVIRTQS